LSKTWAGAFGKVAAMSIANNTPFSALGWPALAADGHPKAHGGTTQDHA